MGWVDGRSVGSQSDIRYRLGPWATRPLDDRTMYFKYRAAAAERQSTSQAGQECSSLGLWPLLWSSPSRLSAYYSLLPSLPSRSLSPTPTAANSSALQWHTSLIVLQVRTWTAHWAQDTYPDLARAGVQTLKGLLQARLLGPKRAGPWGHTTTAAPSPPSLALPGPSWPCSLWLASTWATRPFVHTHQELCSGRGAHQAVALALPVLDVCLFSSSVGLGRNDWRLSSYK